MIASAVQSPESKVVREAHLALSDRLSQLSLRLDCEFREGLLFLRGRVSSYYHKQIAQESVRRLDAVEQVINQIEVVSA